MEINKGMHMCSFNLIDRPWIPVTKSGIHPVSIGLKECLIQAHNIRDVYHNSPLVIVSVYRLLLALVHRIFPAENRKDWSKYWAKGCFDENLINKYFDKWAGRFDLFDSEYPFFQDASLPNDGKDPINKLVRHRAAGNTPVYHDHSMDSQPVSLPAAEAALHLLAFQSYALLDGRGYNPSRLNNGIGCYLQGQNLFQTLMLNMIILPFLRARMPDSDKDMPIWEKERTESVTINTIHGYLDYLTFPIRRVKLVPDESNDGLIVRQMSYAPGSKLPDDIYDPFLRYTVDKKIGWRRIMIDSDKQLWRDYHTLISLSAEENERYPLNLYQTAGFKNDGILDMQDIYTLFCGGLASENAKVILWSFDKLPLPLNLLGNVDFMNLVGSAIDYSVDLSEHLFNRTKKAAQHLLTDKSGQPDKKAVSQLVQTISTEPLYWSELEIPFKEFVLSASTVNGDEEKAFSVWKKHCESALKECWEQVENLIINSPRGPEAIARAFSINQEAVK